MAKKRSLHISVLGSRLTSVVSVTLVLVLLGVAAIMTMAARNATDNVRRNMGFTVKMERGVADSGINAMKKTLARARPRTPNPLYMPVPTTSWPKKAKS